MGRPCSAGTKRRVKAGLLAAVASLGLSAAANATILSSTDVEIWYSTSLGLQPALPGTSALPGVSVLASPTGFSDPLDFNQLGQTGTTIAGFFASDQMGTLPTPSTCGPTCLSDVISTSSGVGTLFKFTFVDLLPEILSVTHDDGVSLFVHNDTINNLLPNAQGPTVARTDSTFLNPGTYDLWYAAENGLPEVLIVDSRAVPGPIVGAGLPGLLAGLGGLVALARRRRNKG
jgi:hypothetical protein